jgi:hypothetical protein
MKARRNLVAPGEKEPRSPRQLAALSRREAEAYGRVLHATSLMQQGYSRAEAARAAGTSPSTIIRYAGSAFEKGRDGRIHAKPANRLVRRIAARTPEGVKFINVAGSRRASLVARHSLAVDRYLETGNARALRRFAGKRVGGVELVTDPTRIEELARRGVLDFEQFYNLR